MQATDVLPERGPRASMEAYRAAFPRVVEYWRRLPDGWDSYPECLVRDTVVDAFRRRGVFDDIGELPPPLARAAHEAAASGWVPEVIYAGLFLAMRDARFPDASDEIVADYWLQVGKDRVDRDDTLGPVVPSGARGALRRALDLWSANHRGTVLVFDTVTDESAELCLEHPRDLIPPTMIDVYAKSIALCLVREDAAGPKVLASQRDGPPNLTVTRFSATWR